MVSCIGPDGNEVIMTAPIVASIIFVVMFAMIIMDKVERHIVTLTAGGLMLVVVFGFIMKDALAVWDTLRLSQFITPDFWITHEAGEEAGGINWATVVFIAGMMVMVEGMAAAGFFRWLCMTIAKLVKFDVMKVLVAFMLMAAVLSMFIDSITVLLFLASVTVELSRLLKFEPVPMVMAEIFCANLGGSATMCGDPPNIIIGTSLGYSFFDFLTNTGFCALIALAVIIPYFCFFFGKRLKANAAKGEELRMLEATINPSDAIVNKGNFIKSTVIFGIAAILLVSHAATGLTVAFIGVLVAVLTVAADYKNVGKILSSVDYKTLLFLIGLFMVVGGLEETGVLELIAGFISDLSGGSIMIMLAIIIWLSGIASAIVDNIPFAATMVPVITRLATSFGMGCEPLAWSLALGTDIGGSASPIGASANVVGLSVCDNEGYECGWGFYCKYMIPASFITLAICTGYIWIRFV